MFTRVIILSLDTSTESCSAALMINNNELIERHILAPYKHTEFILPMIDSLLKEANIKINNLNALAVSCGPGSFTGIRIGIGITQGLTASIDLPIIGISTLKILAEGAWRRTGANKVLTAIDARMGEVYWAMYERKNGNIWISKTPEMVISPVNLNKLINFKLKGHWAYAGTGWKTYPNLINKNYINSLKLFSGKTIFPRAKDMLPLAFTYYLRGKFKSVLKIKANYLRNKIT